MRRSLMRMAVIVGLSAVVGLGYARGVRQLPWQPDAATLAHEAVLRAEYKAATGEKQEVLAQAGVTPARLVQLAESGALVIDARTPAEFEAGHLAAAFIVCLPPEEALASVVELGPAAEAGVPIVIYCESAECLSSVTVYRALKGTFGDMAPLYIYGDGWAGIERAKLPTRTGPAEALEVVVAECVTHFYLGPDADGMGATWPDEDMGEGWDDGATATGEEPTE